MGCFLVQSLLEKFSILLVQSGNIIHVAKRQVVPNTNWNHFLIKWCLYQFVETVRYNSNKCFLIYTSLVWVTVIYSRKCVKNLLRYVDNHDYITFYKRTLFWFISFWWNGTVLILNAELITKPKAVPISPNAVAGYQTFMLKKLGNKPLRWKNWDWRSF